MELGRGVDIVPEHVVSARAGERNIRKTGVIEGSYVRPGKPRLRVMRHHLVQLGEHVYEKNSQVGVGLTVSLHRRHKPCVQTPKSSMISSPLVVVGAEEKLLAWILVKLAFDCNCSRPFEIEPVHHV